MGEEKEMSFLAHLEELRWHLVRSVVAILIVTGRDFLGSLLEERKTAIVTSVQDAEDRLSDAQKRLTEAQKQLNQANLIISEIQTETIKTKKLLLETEALQAKKNLKKYNAFILLF